MNKIISIMLACFLHTTFAVASTYNLRVEIMPNWAGTVNTSSGTYEEGASIYLRTYNNPGFVFKGWYMSDSLISTAQSFYYTMPARNIVIQAKYEYDPDVPENPALPDTTTYFAFTADVSPAGAGTLNKYSGEYAHGAKISLNAYSNSGFHFIGWINESGDTLSTSTYYNYVMPQKDSHLTALYYYDPTVPENPEMNGISRRVTITCKPSNSGTFNITNSKNAVGSKIQLSSYTNTGYKFLYWENENGDTLSTSQTFYYTIPDKDSKVYGIFEFDPKAPESPNSNYWNKERGELILDNFTPGSLSSAASIAIGNSSRSDVKMITIIGRMNSNDFGITNNYSYCTYLDLSRVTGINEIQSYAFDYSSLATVYLPTTIKTINSNAFYGCTNLEYVTIPETVKTIGNNAFKNCTNLENIICKISADSLFVINSNIFAGVDKKRCLLYVPKGAKETYATTEGWAEFEKIIELNSLERYSDGFYKLNSSQDWKDFTLLAELNPKINARMASDIIIGNESSMVGTYNSPFEGIFDGNGYTLITAYNTSQPEIAPFRYVKNAIIENLRVSGNIKTSSNAIGGIVAIVSGESETIIRNSWSSAKLSSGNGNDGDNIGGIVSKNYGKLIIENCLFNGSITNDNSIGNAGFVALNQQELKIYNSLNIGTYSSNSISNCGTFYCQDSNTGTITLENVYYRNEFGTAQGTEVTDEQLTDSTILYYLIGESSNNYWTQSEESPTPLLTDCKKFKLISIDEWEILIKAYEEMGNGKDWNRVWNFSTMDRVVAYVPGIILDNGHITAINLSNNNIKGLFPFTILKLPHLKHINLSNNYLEGNIDSISSYATQCPDYMQSVTEIDISHNKFMGNIGVFANAFPHLIKLNASNNKIEDVYPAIPHSVTSLCIDSQQIERVIDWQLKDFTVETFIEQLPTIISYNHIRQNYTLPINLYISANDKWGMTISYYDETSSIPYISNQNAYKNENGDTLTVTALDVYNSSTGTSLRLKLVFDNADANFDGYVNTLDLQTTILYMFGKYKNKLFNFTAANTYLDSVINVQDIIVTVNILLEDMVNYLNKSKTKNSDSFNNNTTSSARIYNRDGQIILRSNIPVASLSIKANGDINWHLNKYGMIQSTLNGNVVGYYLNGTTLPINEEIVIGEGNNVVIHSATLSDIDANNICVEICNDQSTSINKLCFEDEIHDVYNISGVKHNNTIKGINIIRDNKIFKKVLKK